MVRCLLALSDSLLSLRRHIKAQGVCGGIWPRGAPAPMSSHVCSWERFCAFGGTRQSGIGGVGGGDLTSRGENLLLPAPSLVALKKASGKTGLQARPPPPTINHPNYKDEKDKQRGKEKGEAVTGRKTGGKRRRKEKKSVQTNQHVIFFLPETHFSQRQRVLSDRGGLDLHCSPPPFFFLFFLVPG